MLVKDELQKSGCDVTIEMTRHDVALSDDKAKHSQYVLKTEMTNGKHHWCDWTWIAFDPISPQGA